MHKLMGLNVEVQQISRGERLRTELASIRVESREVNGFYMLPEITTITASLSTDCALVGASSRVLRNVRVKLPVCLACKEGLGQTPLVYSRKLDSDRRPVGFNVQIQEVSGGESLRTVFASVGEHPRHMNIFHMISQVAPVGRNLSTDCTFVGPLACLRASDNVLVQSS